MELSGQFTVKMLCEITEIRRSSFYRWKKSLAHPSLQKEELLKKCGLKLPSKK